MHCSEFKHSPVPGVATGITFVACCFVGSTGSPLSDVGFCLGILSRTAHNANAESQVTGSPEFTTAKAGNDIFIDGLFSQGIINPGSITSGTVPD